MFLANKSKDDVLKFQEHLKQANSIRLAIHKFQLGIKNRKTFDLFAVGLRGLFAQLDNLVRFYKDAGYDIEHTELATVLEECRASIYKEEVDKNSKEWFYILFLVLNELITKMDDSIILERYAVGLRSVKKHGKAFDDFMQTEFTNKHKKRAIEASNIILSAVLSEQ